jgi:hypothetical protein
MEAVPSALELFSAKNQSVHLIEAQRSMLKREADESRRGG